jgi:SAM-dependent methyltransferase
MVVKAEQGGKDYTLKDTDQGARLKELGDFVNPYSRDFYDNALKATNKIPPFATGLVPGIGYGAQLPVVMTYADHLIGIDMQPPAIEVAGKVATKLGIDERITLSVGQVEQITDTVQSGSVNIIFDRFLMQHIPDEALNTTLEQFHTILTDDGIFLAEEFNVPTWHFETAAGFDQKSLMAPFTKLRDALRILQERRQTHVDMGGRLIEIVTQHGFTPVYEHVYHIAEDDFKDQHVKTFLAAKPGIVGMGILSEEAFEEAIKAFDAAIHSPDVVAHAAQIHQVAFVKSAA